MAVATAQADHDLGTAASPARSSRRAVLWAGGVFSVAFVASFVLGPRSDIHDTDSHTLAYYAEDYNKLKGMLGWVLAVVAVLALVWFLAGLVSRLRAAGSHDSETLGVTLAGGLLAATVTVASAIRAAPAGDLLMDSEQRAGSSGKLTETFADFSQTAGSLYDWLMFFGVGLGAAALVFAVSFAAGRTAVFPRWLRWAGYTAVPVLAFLAFFNLFVLVLWVVAVSIVTARAPEPSGPL